jgi:DNA-binding phage protein
MTGPFPLFIPVLATIMALAMLGFGLGVVLSWRSAQRQAEATGKAILTGLEQILNAHLLHIKAMMDAQAAERSAESQEIAQNMETIQSDLEWLAGEKMIEQALQLVQENLPLSQISQETGLTHDTIRTLAAFRTH